MEEYKLKFTGAEIDEKLGKVDQLSEEIADLIVAEGGDTLEWAAITEEQFDESKLVGGFFYPISDAVVTMDDLSQGGSITPTLGETIAFTTEECFYIVPGIIAIADVLFAIAEDNTVWEADDGDTITFPKAGIYVVLDTCFESFTVTIPGYTGFGKETIDPAYLPGAVMLYTDAEAEGYLYAIKDTSDASKRMTKAELMNLVTSGRTAYLHYLDFAYCLISTIVDLGESMGVSFAIGGEYINTHTAEYTG